MLASKGFSLIEFSVVLTVISVLALFAFKESSQTIAENRILATLHSAHQMANQVSALVAVMDANVADALPLPANAKQEAKRVLAGGGAYAIKRSSLNSEQFSSYYKIRKEGRFVVVAFEFSEPTGGGFVGAKVEDVQENQILEEQAQEEGGLKAVKILNVYPRYRQMLVMDMSSLPRHYKRLYYWQ